MKAGKDYIGVGGGILIVNDNSETLLLKRTANSKNDAGVWSKPGGSVEYGETVDEMLKREIVEELGVEIEILKYFHHTDHILKDEGQHWVAFNALGKIKKGEPKNMEPNKHSEICWFPLDKLPKKLAQPTRESIEEYLRSNKQDRSEEINPTKQ